MPPIHEIPGKLSVYWEPSVKAIVDVWTSYAVTVDQFREAVLVKGLGHATRCAGRAWIVDSSGSTGAFSREVQTCIEREVFPQFAANGILTFITTSTENAVTQMSIERYQSKLGPNGIRLVEAASRSAAIEWLKKSA